MARWPTKHDGAPVLLSRHVWGYTCDCGWSVTGRTPMAIDQAMNDHNRYRHLDESIRALVEAIEQE